MPGRRSKSRRVRRSRRSRKTRRVRRGGCGPLACSCTAGHGTGSQASRMPCCCKCGTIYEE